MNKEQQVLTRKKLPRVCLGIYIVTGLSAILYLLFTKLPAFADWFNGSVSALGRRVLSFFSGVLPFSLAEMLLLLLPLLLVVLIVIGYRHFCGSNRDLLVYVGILFSAVCVIGILFVFNFAPGYYGRPLNEKLALDRQKCSAEELYQTAEILSAELDALSEEIVFLEDGSSLMPYSYAEMNEKLMEAYDKFVLRYEGVVVHFDSRIKPVMLSEPMSYTHITGVYSFFTGEANVNVNFPDYTVPFTAAHELAHQRGIAREDEANFVAFLVCIESDDPYIRYSAYLNLYEYVLSALRTADAELYRKSYYSLPALIRLEEQAYAAFYEKYSDNIAADISETVNNSYLQSQGAAEGTRSYNMVVDLAVAYYRPFFR